MERRSPSSNIVIDRGDDGAFVEFIGGELDGEMLFFASLTAPTSNPTSSAEVYQPPGPRFCELSVSAQQQSRATARVTLFELLNQTQQHDFETTGTFWEPFDTSSVIQLGRMHHLTERCATGEVESQVLCVVPRGPRGEMPPEDEWTNLLLLVRHAPEQVRAIANVLSSSPRQDHAVFGSISATTAQLRRLVQHRSAPTVAQAKAAHELGVREWTAGRHDRAATWFRHSVDLAHHEAIAPSAFATACLSAIGGPTPRADRVASIGPADAFD